MSQEVVKKTTEYVKQKMLGEGTGHDWWHVLRVWRLAKRIAKEEKTADLFIVELGALLHDIADWKFHEGDMEAGPKAARQWLKSQEVNELIIKQVEHIVRDISFKGAGVKPKLQTIEAKIVSDADKLDGLGAIGIARAFAYGGSKNRPLYEPDKKPVMHQTFEAYKANKDGHTINHFYEKLLLLKDRMFTKTARNIAASRHAFMEQYLDEFYAEWEGKK